MPILWMRHPLARFKRVEHPQRDKYANHSCGITLPFSHSVLSLWLVLKPRHFR